MQRFAILLCTASFLLAVSCQDDSHTWEPSAKFEIELPLEFGEPAPWSLGLEPTEASVQFGKLLFNDPALSADGQVACSSCHLKTGAFSDPGEQTSSGVFGKTGKRNTPSLQNLIWMPYFMWDGGITHLEVMPIAPIINPVEHGISLREFVHRAEVRYPTELYNAFGTDSATSQLILRALAHYMMTFVSANSPFDFVQRGERAYTNMESQGKVVFDTYCANCHSGPLQTSWEFSYHGPAPTNPMDSGRYKVTLNPNDLGLVRIPSLRNWSFSAPYMHDGRLSTIQDVLDDWQQATGNSLAPSSRQALIQFLFTLNDTSYVE